MVADSVLTRVVDPTGWAYLDNEAPIRGLNWQWDYPGGPTSASLTLNAPAGAHLRSLSQGATLTTHRGGIVWAGRVSSIDRAGWNVQADGLAGLVAQEPVRITGTLDAIIDDCIANGLGLTRPASLSTQQWGTASGGIGTLATPLANVTLDQVLSQVLSGQGKYWRVNLAGQILAETAPTTPTLIVHLTADPPLTLNNYATRVTGLYSTTSTGAPTAQVTVVDTAAETKFGRTPVSIDLTRFGGISSTAATLMAQAYLDRVSPRMVVSGDVPVLPGQMTTASGGPVDLALLKPGVVARVQLVTAYRDALVIPTSAIDMLIGRVTYDVDSGAATLAPVGTPPNPLALMFGGRASLVS